MKKIAIILSAMIFLTACSSSQTETESYEDVWEETESYGEASEETSYVGSVNSDIYHYPDCIWAEKIYDENEILFDSADDAENRGYRGCYVCTY